MRTEDGKPRKIIVEVGPITVHGAGKRDVAKMERSMRDDLDAYARSYFKVGKRSKVVRSRLEDAK